ncbi:MAG: sensor histidine kinase [Flavobacteriaceae bacterium]
MKKRFFILTLVLMSFSLVGIISIQAYFIIDSYQSEQERFSFKVKKALAFTAKTLEDREYRNFYRSIQILKNSGIVMDTTTLRNMYIFQDESDSKITRIYRNGVMEENFRIPSFLDYSFDSIYVTQLRNEREMKRFESLTDAEKSKVTPESVLLQIEQASRSEKVMFETSYRDLAKINPIHRRVKEDDIKTLLGNALNNDDIDIAFEFAVFESDQATSIQSDNFEFNQQLVYGSPMFLDNEGLSDFTLYVSFPDRVKFVFSTILGITVLSIIFTLIIILAFGSTINQLIKQRKISQIKSDFINNMTHELKTPIATIGLALDAIKNPKVIGNQEQVERYLKMIKDENKRMHAQVENVLRISQLEKNDLNLTKERVKLHDLIHDAIAHIELILAERNGIINTHLNAPKSAILASDMHMTNVIVNILDNAIKYSDGAPEIAIRTELVGNFIVMSISDKGQGMTKADQKQIFEKFFRVHTGDVHNVKGQGLGLAYVKSIVLDHQGGIDVDSEKGKGSTFTIKLPIIS